MSSIHDFSSLAIKSYPDEVVALVYNDTINIVANMAANKSADFIVSHHDFLTASESDTGLQELIHSHAWPHSRPSLSDINTQLTLRCLFSILTTDGLTVRDFYQWGRNESSYKHL